MKHDDGREQRLIDRALAALDQPASPLRVESILAHAAEAERPSRVWLPRAAAAVAALVLVGAAAWAIPGSPVKRWVMSVVSRARPQTQAPSAPPEDGAGIAVDPGMRLTVKFMAKQPQGEIQVLLGAGHELTVRAPAGAATFRSEMDRLVVDNRGGSQSFTVVIPRDAPRVVIVLDERVVFLKVGPEIEGDWRIPLR